MKKYIVIETEDLEKYLNETEHLRFSNLREKLCDSRQEDGKTRVPDIEYTLNDSTSRTPKYKAQRIDNGEWIYGSLIEAPGRVNPGCCYIAPEISSLDFDTNSGQFSIGGFYEVNPETIMRVFGYQNLQPQVLPTND